MERKEGVFGRLVLKDAQQAEYLRSLLRFGAAVDESDSLNGRKTIFHQIYFHVSRKEHIVEEIRQGTVDCPCLWADLGDIRENVAQLHVAYDIGSGIQIPKVPIRAVRVEPKYEDAMSGPLVVSCVGYVQKRMYLILYRLVHVLFPSLEAWKRSLQQSDDIDFSRERAERRGVVYVDSDSDSDGLVFSMAGSHLALPSGVFVKPNLLLGCLEARSGAYDSGGKHLKFLEEESCLRTVRQLNDVMAILKGCGSIASNCTPLPSPHRQPAFESPAKKAYCSDASTMNVTIAVSMIQSASSAEFRDGTLYLQNVCSDPGMAEAAIQKGVLKALVRASSMLLDSRIMGSVEQLSILTLTCSLMLDKAEGCLSRACRELVNEFKEHLAAPCANPLLLVQFITAMVHRTDVKEAAIDLKLHNALSEMYLSKLTLLEPLAEALLSRRVGDYSPQEPAGSIYGGNLSREKSSSSVNSSQSLSRKTSVPLLWLDTLTRDEEGLCNSPSSGLTRATRRDKHIASQILSEALPVKTQTASREMDHLAQALGESLVAQDLPALIGHRRRLASECPPLSAHGVLKEEFILGQHTSSTADLRAHKLLMAEYSDDSDEEADTAHSASNAAPISQETASQVVETESFTSEEADLLDTVAEFDVCPYLIHGMLAIHNPFPGCFYMEPDPSTIITANVLSFPVQTYEDNSYIKSCLKLLACISSAHEHSEHVFLLALASKLESMVHSSSFGTDIGYSSLAYYLSIALEYVSLCSDGEVSVIFAQTALHPVSLILSQLSANARDISGWGSISLTVLNLMLKLLTRVVDLCDSDEAGRSFICVFFGEANLMSLLQRVSGAILLSDIDYDSSDQTDIAELEKVILSMFVSLANLVGSQRAISSCRQQSISGDVICKFHHGRESKILTRAHCLQQFYFLILPGSRLIRVTLEGEIPGRESGHLQGHSEHLTLSSRSVRLRNGVFALLLGLFSARQSPFMEDKELTDYYVRLHFIRFLKLYHNPNRDHQGVFLCRQHLSVLCTLAQAARKSQNSYASKRFQQLSVVGFFVKEMSLEYESLESEVRYSHMRSESSVDSGVFLDRSTCHGTISINSSSNGSLLEDDDGAPPRQGTGKAAIVPSLCLNIGASIGTEQALGGSSIGGVFKEEPASLNTPNTDTAMILSATMPEETDAFNPGFATRVLERQGTSAALSLDTPVKVSGNGFEDVQTQANSKNVEELPLGFTFTGDLDEDVDRLEALESGGDSDETFSESLGSLSDTSESEFAEDLSFSKPKLPLQLPSSQDTRQSVPRLSISSSMRSSLHKRNESAELMNAAAHESEMRKEGRSFFGDLERQALGHGKMQAVRFSVLGESKRNSLASSNIDEISNLEKERSSRLLYQDSELHILAIKLIFMLIIDGNGQLHSGYCDRYPWDRKMQNIPFILQHHLNASPTRELLPRIESALQYSIGKFAVIFLRVLCADFFRPSWYTSRVRISGATGAYATVYRCELPWWAEGKNIVLKIIDAPKHNHDRCSQVEFYSEVAIHEKLSKHPRVCQMLDFGVDTRADALVLVLEEFKCSLKQWRLVQEGNPDRKLGIYWTIFREIVVACIEMLNAGVVHFDLKCDNVLLNPLDDASEEDFWRGMCSEGVKFLPRKKKETMKLSFKVVLGDFGESVIFPGGREGAEEGSTLLARGTDAFKSPEMLMIGGASQVHQRGYDRRKYQGAGAASDVWSLGCLLFELFTGKMLFSDNDWLQLAARVTTPGSQLITDEKMAMVSNLPGVEELLKFILVRDPKMRPTVEDVLQKIDSLDIYGSMSCSGGPMPKESSKSNREKPRHPSLKERLSDMAGDPEYPIPITCLIHITENLSVCSVKEYIRLKKSRHTEQRKHILILSSKLATDVPIWDSKLVKAFSKKSVLESEDLLNCLEDIQINNGRPVLINCPITVDAYPQGLSSWISSTLDSIHANRLGFSETIILSDNIDHMAAFLSIAIMIRETGSMYSAMVQTAHCGLDRHLHHVMLESLRNL